MNTITENIRYVGADDDNLDLFEGQYPIPNGVSYNSYLIDDRCTAIVDAVDVRRCSDWLTAVDITLGEAGKSAPDYLIVQHVEPDHSGSIKAVMRLYPGVKVVCTAKAADMLRNFFEDVDFASRTVIVGDGDTLQLGDTTLRFVTAPMVHWPEVMVTLDCTHKVLFSADAFGTFAMSTSQQGWDAEARRYYANIVGRFGNSVQSLMKKIASLKFDIVAPLHGPVLRDNLAHHWGLYDKWSRWQPECRGVLIAYASIYGGTARAARQLATILKSRFDGEVELFDLCRHDVSYAVAEAFRLSHIVLASVTYDGDLFPAMHTFLHHLQRKNLANRTVALIENGSWAPVAARLMGNTLATMKNINIVGPTVTLRSTMHKADIATLETLATNLLAE